MQPDSNKTAAIIRNYEIMIGCEMEAIQLQIKLINANQSGHFTLNKIIVKDARSAIVEGRGRIKLFAEMKLKEQLKLT